MKPVFNYSIQAINYTNWAFHYSIPAFNYPLLTAVQLHEEINNLQCVVGQLSSFIILLEVREFVVSVCVVLLWK